MMDSLGDRMKTYEKAYNIKLPIRMPVILRLDGKAFHTLLKKAEKPFDETVTIVMNKVCEKLIKEIQGATFCYTQSDEINIFINNYQSLVFDPWFDNKIQKICSITASIASVEFSKLYGKDAVFDCRALVLPKEDVVNYFIWRQKDWVRNSVQMLGRSLFSHKNLHGKNCDSIKKMCKPTVNWDTLHTHIKYGRCFSSEGLFEETSLFTEERDFIQRFVDYTKEE